MAERRLAMWTLNASETEYRIACLVSSSLELTDSLLLRLNSAVWNQPWGSEHQSSWERLKRRAFLEPTQRGYRIDLSMARVIADQFEQEHSEEFRRTFEVLAKTESDYLQTSGVERSAHESWYAEGRLAYYLAPISADDSDAQFQRTFLDVPDAEFDGRNWLTGLALSQQRFLGEHWRTLTFMRAFRDYQEGRREEASRDFERVLDESHDDEWDAIASHLWSVINPKHSQAADRLDRALTLSRHLGLDENYAMSANTAVYRLIESAEKVSPPHRDELLLEATSLAAEAVEAARRRGAPYIVLVTEETAVVAEWLLLSRLRTTPVLRVSNNRCFSTVSIA